MKKLFPFLVLAVLAMTACETPTEVPASQNDLVRFDVVSPDNHPPTADPNGPYMGAVGENVALDGSASFDPDGDALTWAWDLDDDGEFDDASGAVTTGVFSAPGIVPVCLQVTDPFGVNDVACTIAVVYDPGAGFVTGGGWIDSPIGAYRPQFIQTFDSDPVLAASQTPGAWYVDRYAPAGFESTFFDGDYRLMVSIDDADYLPYSNTFYNYQGRKYDVGSGIGSTIFADLYIGDDWAGKQRHASLWATMVDENGDLSGYPIVGYTEGSGLRYFTQDTDQDPSNGYNPGWVNLSASVDYGQWANFRVELTAESFIVYVNGAVVFEDVVTFDSEVFSNLMLQAYNYGEDYRVYWDNVGVSNPATGKATFGFNAKYKKGAKVPDGNTEFQFKAANLNFHSTAYDWLVVNQGGENAQFKGVGTVNGMGEYKFMLWAGDHDSGDTFRIKIWEEIGGTESILYDNGMDQPISGGSIVVHTKK